MFLPRLIAGLLLLAVLSTSKVDAVERRISALFSRDFPRYHAIHEVFSQQLDGDDVVVLRLIPDENDASLQREVRRALAAGPNIIVTYGAAATRAALIAGSTIPVVYADVVAPVLHGLISASSTPGRT